MNKYQKILDEICLATCLEQDIGHYRLMVLQELINMHNEPLKLEEIKPDMWVWDAIYKAYAEVYLVDNETIYLVIGDFDYRRKYSESIFYRYQPLKKG